MVGGARRIASAGPAVAVAGGGPAAIFKADVQKLPAYVGIAVGDGYSLFRITKVTQSEKIDENQLKALRNEYANVVAQEDLSTYLSSLRSRYKIDVNKALLENRERQ